VSATRLQFGIAVGAYSSGVPDARELAEFARTAEAVGFDSVQVGDHIQWHAPILEATVVMATFAAVTTRVRIASDVVILPLRDPVLIAKTIASLDVLSGGRMIFGIGVGGDHPAEYSAMRVPLRERGSRANESLEIVRGLFANERFSYVGQHFTIEDVAIAPRPLQPAVPIWVGGTSDAALRRAARYGHGWISAFASERKFVRLADTLRRFLAEERRSSEGFTWGSFLFVNFGPDAA
jgi:probable F420-dependent oxidoreductase